jgi:hypothetical protein
LSFFSATALAATKFAPCKPIATAGPAVECLHHEDMLIGPDGFKSRGVALRLF